MRKGRDSAPRLQKGFAAQGPSLPKKRLPPLAQAPYPPQGHARTGDAKEGYVAGIWVVRSISTNRLVAIAAGETLDSLGRSLTGHWAADDCEAMPMDSFILFADPAGGGVVPATDATPGTAPLGDLAIFGVQPIMCLLAQAALWGAEEHAAWQPVDPDGTAPATRLARLLARPDGEAIVAGLLAQSSVPDGPDINDLLDALPESELPVPHPTGPLGLRSGPMP